MAPVPQLLDASAALVARSFGIGGPALDMVITELVLQPIAMLLVANRLWIRRSSKKGFGMDDYVIVTSLVFCIAMNVVNIVAVDHGYGRPSSTLPPKDRRSVLQLFYVLQILYKCTINLTKLSILLLYRKIFDTDMYRFRLICNIIGVFVMLYAVASVIANIFECTPVAKQWDTFLPGSCISLTGFWYANAVYNISSDFIILLLPLPIIYRLNLPFRRKIALMAIFGLGLFVCATSIIRSTTLDVSSKAIDQSEGTVISVMWSTIEAETGIICSCLPMLRIPMTRLCPFLCSSYHPSDNGPSIRSYRFSDVEVQERSGATKRASEGDGSSTVTPRQHVHVAFLPSQVAARQMPGVLPPVPDSSLSLDQGDDDSDRHTGNRPPDNLPPITIPGSSLYPHLSSLPPPMGTDDTGQQTSSRPSGSTRCNGPNRSFARNGICRPPALPPMPPPNTPPPPVPLSPDSPTIPEQVHTIRGSESPVNQSEKHDRAEVWIREVSS